MEHEIEIKLAISQKKVEKLLSCAFFQALTTKPIKKTLKNIYFDTDDWQLQSKKIALRIRQSDDQFIQTLKTSGMSKDGLSKRKEWEWYIPGEKLDISLLPQEYWPSDIVPLALKAQFNTNFCRRIWYFEEKPLGSDDVTIIEIALDQGQIEASDRREVISELELELKQGNADVLIRVAKTLRQQCENLFPSDLSKAARGFKLLENPT